MATRTRRTQREAAPDDQDDERADAVSTAIVDTEDEGDRPETESDFLRPDGSLSPDAPFWAIKVTKRTRANHTASFNWQHAVTYNGERWVDWVPSPPLDRVEKDCGTGDFRFEVFHRSKRPRMELYPEMAGPMTFYIPHASEAGSTSSTPAAAPPLVRGESPAPAPAPAPQLDMAALVRSVAEALRPVTAAPSSSSSSGGISQEMHTSITMTRDKADKLERLLERLLDQQQAGEKLAVKEEAARQVALGDIVRRVDELGRKLEAIEKRDPVADIQKLRLTAEALGMEAGGQVGLWKEGIGALRDIIQHQNAAQAGLPSSPGQRQIDNPQPKEGSDVKHWHTADEGSWKLLGDLCHWIGQEIVGDKQPTTDQIIFKAFELVGASEVDSKWLSECGPDDVKKLFAYVWGDAHQLLAHWNRIVPYVTTVLAQYPVHVANKMAEARRDRPQWLTEALVKRGALKERVHGSVVETKGRESSAAAGSGAPATTS